MSNHLQLEAKHRATIARVEHKCFTEQAEHLNWLASALEKADGDKAALAELVAKIRFCSANLFQVADNVLGEARYQDAKAERVGMTLQ